MSETSSEGSQSEFSEHLASVVSRLSELTALSEELAQAEDEEACFLTVARRTVGVLAVDRVSIAVPEPNEPTFRVLKLEGKGVMLPPGSHMLIMGTAVGAALDGGGVITTMNEPVETYSDWRHLNTIGLENFIVVPLTSPDGIIGTLNIGTGKGHPFAPVDVLMARQVGLQLATHLRLRRRQKSAPA